MAEVGLVRFTQVAMEVAQSCLPPYAAPRSKHVFTQHQLVTLVCLMRYARWTYREAEVRLAEHGELRIALELSRVPDFTTLAKFFHRLTHGMVQRVLEATVQRMPSAPPIAKGGTTVAADATGLETSSASTYYIKRLQQFGIQRPRRAWVKSSLLVDVPQRFIVAQEVSMGPENDGPALRALLTSAQHLLPIGLVLADAGYDSERNHQFIRQVIGAHSVIPAKRGKATWRVCGVRAEMRAAFPAALYHQRALVEAVISALKRKIGAFLPGRSLAAQLKQAALLGVVYNLYRLRPCPSPLPGKV